MATYNALNPLRSVGGTYVRVPSSYVWNCEDVSQADSGRTEDGLMHKKKIREVVKLNVAWQNIPTADVSEILNAFSAEYINIQYLDAKQGGYLTKTFYVGGRTAPVYNTNLDLWSEVSFNLIER